MGTCCQNVPVEMFALWMMLTMVINKDNIESRLGDVLSKCPGGANNGFDHNFVMANTEAPLNFVCRVSRS